MTKFNDQPVPEAVIPNEADKRLDDLALRFAESMATVVPNCGSIALKLLNKSDGFSRSIVDDIKEARMATPVQPVEPLDFMIKIAPKGAQNA
jgi:hypothetical protein